MKKKMIAIALLMTLLIPNLFADNIETERIIEKNTQKILKITCIGLNIISAIAISNANHFEDDYQQQIYKTAGIFGITFSSIILYF